MTAVLNTGVVVEHFVHQLPDGGTLHIMHNDDDMYGHEVNVETDDEILFSVSFSNHEWSESLALLTAQAMDLFLKKVEEQKDPLLLDEAIQQLYTLEYTDAIFKDGVTSDEEHSDSHVMKSILLFVFSHLPKEYMVLKKQYNLSSSYF